MESSESVYSELQTAFSSAQYEKQITAYIPLFNYTESSLD